MPLLPRAVVALVLAAFLVSGCGSEQDERPGSRDVPAADDPGPIHVHGLGVNPRDGALFLATHTGLFRVGDEAQAPTRVGDRYQDTMGFTVVGADRFLGSGHPDGRDGLPPFLGLVESTDAGRSWDPVSLLGRVDFHVLEAMGSRVYGFGTNFETRRPQFMVGSDRGRTWAKRRVPRPLISLAISPDDPDSIVASDGTALYGSEDAGRSWRTLSGPGGLLAWTDDGTLSVATASGAVAASVAGEAEWVERGQVGGEPAAFDSAGNELLLALHNGTIKSSVDGGRTWQVRSRPFT